MLDLNWKTPCFLLLSLGAVTAACSEESDGEAPEGEGGAAATGGAGGDTAVGGAGGAESEPYSCVPYEPTEAGETVAADWSDDDDADDYSITVPADPGGGYVTLTVDTEATGMSPSVVVQAMGDNAGAVTSGSSAGMPDESITTHRFEVAPGMTYNVDVGQFGAADEDYPVEYSYTWTFTSLVDCYELNDEPADAKAIALGEEITAYSVAGFTTNGFSNPSLVDWYSVELEETGVLEVDMSQTPGDDRMSIRIFAADGTTQVGAGGNTMGEPFTSTTTDPVEVGTYLIAVETADAASRITIKDETTPTAWSNPYVIEASVR